MRNLGYIHDFLLLTKCTYYTLIFAGVLAVGLFADNPVPLDTTNGRMGLFKGGGWYLLGIQSLSALCLTCWGICSTFALLWVINKLIPIRMDPNEELLGADLMEHRIRHSQIGLSRALSALQPLQIDLQQVAGIAPIGMNPRHEEMLEEIRLANEKINQWHAYYDKMTPKKSALRKRGSLRTTGGSILKASGHLFSRRHRKNNGHSTGMAAGVAPSGTFTSTDADLSTVTSVSGSTAVMTGGKTDDQKIDGNFAWVD